MRICKLGEDVLRQKCEPVKPEEINDEFRALIEEMFDTMISANGVGLAAPQVGIAKRFFVLMSDDDVRRVFINPEIIKTSAETSEYEEGCLSLPGYSENIVRPVKISISALNEKGKPFVINDADGLLARIIQHENDHL
ncbi:MAG: peptide deformylase, partial [Spirochaetia bacterium]|nr:peptide deformylase [Spirochaetia bacterium]